MKIDLKIRAMAVVAGITLCSLHSHAGLFKIDFGHLQNEAEIIEYEVDFFDGEVFGAPVQRPTGETPEPLTDWDVIPTWTFADPNAEITEGSASIEGTANDAGTEVTWNLRDFGGTDSDVTMTMLDNVALSESVSPDSPPVMLGQIANNPTHEGFAYLDFDGNPVPLFPHIAEIVYDGILVPFVVKDDYNYRNPDTGGTEVLMRFANVDPGFYNVTVFEGRTTDANRTGRVWVGDVDGSGAPAEQNTGNYSGINSNGQILAWGQPRTVTVEINEGDYLWFAEQEDNSGGISGMIIRSVDLAPPPADVTASPGLFKLDFGSVENEREQLDADGFATGEFLDPLSDWNVIPTWSFADPNSEVTAGSASTEGTASADGAEVTWNITDYSNEKNQNVTMTILDNVALSESLGLAPPLGQIHNNPTKELYEAVYDGVIVPAVVKDDYNYRNPDTAGTELFMRFAGLNPGQYNVTVFEGRTTDANRTGKIWVDDDASGANGPAEENTGNFGGLIDGVIAVDGQPRTVTLDVGAGQFLFFAEMEDNSGGISGLIIRGTGGSAATPGPEPEPMPASKVASSSGAITEPSVVDFGALDGDASYEFYFTAIKDGASTAVAGNDSFAIKLDQWNEQGVFGTTAFGVADNLFTAAAGQSVDSVFGAPVHVVVVNDTGAGESRLYIDGGLAGAWGGNFVLPGDTKVMGARLEAATDHMGAGSVMHSWATYSGILTGDEIAGIFGSLPEIVVPTDLTEAGEGAVDPGTPVAGGLELSAELPATIADGRVVNDTIVFNTGEDNLDNWEPFSSVVGNSVFVVEANTFAEDDLFVNQNYAVAFQPVAGGALVTSAGFYGDDGTPYTGPINGSRQNGNPGRVAADRRPGATTYVVGGEASPHLFDPFQSDGRWNLGFDRLGDGRYAAVQSFSLDPSTLASTSLSPTLDAINGRVTSGEAGGSQIGRFGGDITVLDNGNIVVVADDRSQVLEPSNSSTAVILAPDGSVVKDSWVIDPRDIWSNVTSYLGGFAVRVHEIIYFHDNEGNLSGQVDIVNDLPSELIEPGVASFDTGRGDSTRINGHINSPYVYLAGAMGILDAEGLPVEDENFQSVQVVRIAAFDSTKSGAASFVGSAVVNELANDLSGDEDKSFLPGLGRVNLASDALDRIAVAYEGTLRDEFGDSIGLAQTFVRVLSFDGQSGEFGKLTPSFFAYVNQNDIDIRTFRPTVAMTTEAILVAGKGEINSGNDPDQGPDTPQQATFYTVFAHPAPQADPTPGLGGTGSNLAISVAGDQVSMTWDGTAVLKSSSDVSGPYSPVAGATSPYQTAADQSAAFYIIE